MLSEQRDTTPRISPNRCRAPRHGSTFATMEVDDSLLSARLQAGDSRALAEVFDAHAAAIYRVAMGVLGNPVTAQAVGQDVFIQLWSRPSRLHGSLGARAALLAIC